MSVNAICNLREGITRVTHFENSEHSEPRYPFTWRSDVADVCSRILSMVSSDLQR